MKKLAILLFSCLLICSCSSTKPATSGSLTSTATANASNGHDGSSMQKAVIINAEHEMQGVAAEYDWLSKNYSGYTDLGQSLVMDGNHPYDIIHIKYNGKKMDVYFDIIKYFGK